MIQWLRIYPLISSKGQKVLNESSMKTFRKDHSYFKQIVLQNKKGGEFTIDKLKNVRKYRAKI